MLPSYHVYVEEPIYPKDMADLNVHTLELKELNNYTKL